MILGLALGGTGVAIVGVLALLAGALLVTGASAGAILRRSGKAVHHAARRSFQRAAPPLRVIEGERALPPTPQAPDFIRSVPMWKALEPHTILALEMNGKPLAHLHGGPARAIVPGFVGSASVKWLERIVVLVDEFDGFYMKSNYTAPRADNEKQVYSLQSLEVKSVIVGPSEGARLAAGRTAVWGWAWSGEGELTGIDVSTDGGQSWTEGTFTGSWSRYSWRKWEYEWDARPGTHTVMARASDSLGRIQPTSRAFNRLGYRWNVIHAVKVDVA